MKALARIKDRLGTEKEKLYFIHYSCQSLSDENEGYSPKITSIAILHMLSSQMHSFSVHLTAEEMGISRENIFPEYDKIERKMLESYFSFVESKKHNSLWIHWNMSNINYGFEALEHRYRILTGNTAIHIDENSKYNLTTILKKKYGKNFAKDPKMINLMELNGGKDRYFLTGEEEVTAFKAKEFVKLHNSTMCKVYFFRDVFGKAMFDKLRTDTNQIRYKIQKLYEHPATQILGILGIIGSLISLAMFFFPRKGQ